MSEFSYYFADIRATLEDVNDDGAEEIVVDYVMYGGTNVRQVYGGWLRRIVLCRDGECRVIWSDHVTRVSSIWALEMARAGLDVRRCVPEFTNLDDDAKLELRNICTGFEYEISHEWLESESGSVNVEDLMPFPLPFSAEKRIAPLTETVFDWDGRVYTQTSHLELASGQIISKEYSYRTQEAKETVYSVVSKSWEGSDPRPTHSEIQTAIDRAWGVQKQGETLVLAALGDVAPHEGLEAVGLIASDEAELCRLVAVSTEPTGFHTPAQTITLTCETNFARLETLDLDKDGRDEILFNTLIVTTTEPFVYDRLIIYTWVDVGLELLFEGIGQFPDGVTRGIYATDLDGDGVYEIVQGHALFGLGPLGWPTLDRIYSVYKWDAETGRYTFWQKRREPYDRPGEIEILEEATP